MSVVQFLTRRIPAVHLLLLCLISGASLLTAAEKYYLKIEDEVGKVAIAGDSVIKGFENLIEVQSFSWSVVGKKLSGIEPPLRSLEITAYPVKQSPLLAAACARGKILPKVTFQIVQTGETSDVVVLQCTMTNALIRNWGISGAAGSSFQESFALDFESIKYETSRIDVRGKLAKGGEVTLSNK